MKYLLCGLVVCAVMMSAKHAQAAVLHNLGTILVSNDVPTANTGSYPTNPRCLKDGCIGRLWIYYSDANRATQWGTINKNDGMGKYARDIVCRQLGYKASNDSTVRPPSLSNNDVPIWLTSVDCPDAPGDVAKYKNNILQCNTQLCEGCQNHEEDVIMSCYGESHKSDSDYYDGEVHLSPPTGKPYGMQASLGVIQVHLRGVSRSIALNSSSDVANHFPTSKRDSLCKQMGFTRAVFDSVYSVSAVRNVFDFDSYNPKSWFQITALSQYCNGNEYASTPCFGCCFEYPKNNSGCPANICTPDKAIVISCLYETVNEHIDYAKKGTEDICQFQNMKLSDPNAVCNYDYKGTPLAIPFLIVFLILAIIIIIILIIVIFVRDKIKDFFRDHCCNCNQNRYNNIF